MVSRDLLKSWHEAVEAVDEKNWESALKIFSAVAEPPSKIDFNVGCLRLSSGNPEGALKAFDRAVAKDSCLAVGFFQRGSGSSPDGEICEALSDCRMALEQLRDNRFIDYNQLGLRYTLYAWEVSPHTDTSLLSLPCCRFQVVYNTAAAQARLGLWPEARRSLEGAGGRRPEGRPPALDVAVERVRKRLFLDPLQIPPGEVFRPRKRYVEQLRSMDFLGKPKVISSIVPNDGYTGFEPLRPRVRTEPPGGFPATSASDENSFQWALRDSTGSPPPSLPPRFLLTKRPNPRPTESIRYVACTVLSVSEPHSSSTELPPGPGLTQGPFAAGEMSHGPGRPIQLQVRCAFTLALDVSRDITVSNLRALLREKLLQRTEEMQLSYRHRGSQESVLVSEGEGLEEMWQRAADGKLNLWCQDPPDGGSRSALRRTAARHGFRAPNPEDLEFSKGDTLDVLSEVNAERSLRRRLWNLPQVFRRSDLPRNPTPNLRRSGFGGDPPAGDHRVGPAGVPTIPANAADPRISEGAELAERTP
ncbi:LOW QUALITY PROTEIN: NADPH oxidase activator 1 [Ornithorhynchus anatinus]|uniref:LOW QUALITY PROTEIN: NADPH oxidase activator 1 n=1 Tax=Ornithorhynchus anatinus TaxID=9258 RepID=UPI0019D4C087|nr:LOW QUALITY PROTEIN: NADPH oxidase activator 1 [Ornithorhynchus anatinus]